MLRLLAKNAGSNISVMVVQVCISFIMAPVIVHALGNYDYGLWELVASLVGYMGILDMGMRPAVTRYVAKYHAVNDRKALDALFNTAVIFSAAIGVLASTILVAWAIFNPERLAEHNTDASRYVFFLLIIGLQLLFQFPGYIAECFHMGQQRHYLKNNILIINTLVGNTVLYYLLTHGFGLLTLALGNCIGFTLKYLIYFALLFSKRYGGFRLKRHSFSSSMMKTLISFGGKSFVMGTAGTLAGGVAKVVIGLFLGPAALPFYTIPARLVTYISDFNTNVSNVFMPMFSHLQSRGEEEQLKELYMVATKYIVAATCPLAIGVSLLGSHFIHRWIGPEYADGCNYILYFLAAGTMLYLINPLFSRLLTGTGQVGVLAIIRSVGTLLLFVNALLFVRPYGNEGVAFAYLATYLLIAPYEFWYAAKKLNLKISQFLWRVYAPLVLPNAALFLFVAFMVDKLQPYTYPMIGLVVLTSMPVYLISFVLFSMSGEEKNYLHQQIKSRLS